jgi:hypothetical protein
MVHANGRTHFATSRDSSGHVTGSIVSSALYLYVINQSTYFYSSSSSQQSTGRFDDLHSLPSHQRLERLSYARNHA